MTLDSGARMSVLGAARVRLATGPHRSVSVARAGLGKVVVAREATAARVDAKRSGASLSIETCPHYMAFSSEEVPDGDTRFKCSPPIRDDTNRENLWKALLDGHIDMPAKLAGQKNKGAILPGYHADIVVWKPKTEFQLDNNHAIYHKHQNISAYLGKQLSGKVLSTFVRGNLVFAEDKHANAACGVPILAK
uniref:Allantoinase n=1 Tax=Zea mays TaxID=4577 RepID=A0A804R0W6_MAIZE